MKISRNKVAVRAGDDFGFTNLIDTEDVSVIDEFVNDVNVKNAQDLLNFKSLIQKMCDSYDADFGKFPRSNSWDSLDQKYSRDRGRFYKKWRPAIDKCKEIIKSVSVSGYGRLDYFALKLIDKMKSMEYTFPYGWKSEVYGSSRCDDCDDRYTNDPEPIEGSEDYEDDIQEIGQEFTSENTSINSSKLPAIFKLVSFEPGTVNIDYGGGRFDNVAEYLTQFDVINLVYDPYNRSKEHNREVIKTVREHGGADTATCSNVLNVIKEPEVRKNVLENMKKLVKPDGTVYITVYEGTGRGNEGATKSGYQLNRKTADYLEEIQQVFPDAKRKGKLIIAHPSSSANSATSIESARRKRRKAINLDVLKQELLTESRKFMQEPEQGFSEDDLDEYLFVDVSLTADGHVRCEVRAEMSYDGMFGLAQRLNPIVEKYDEYAYFDNVTYGIIEAYITEYSQIVSSATYSSLNGTLKDFLVVWKKPNGRKGQDTVTAYDREDAENQIREEYGDEVQRILYVYVDKGSTWDEAASIESANYGGAYDVDPNQYFTKEDILEFGDEIADQLTGQYGRTWQLNDAYIVDYRRLVLEFEDVEEQAEYTAQVNIDMRKIRTPKDISKYSSDVLNQIYDDYNDYHPEEVESCGSLENVTSSSYSDPEPPTEPPSYDDPDYQEFEEELDVDLDFIINIDKDGNWDYEDQDFKWLRDQLKDEYWYAESVPDYTIYDINGIVETIDDLMEDKLPVIKGKYHVTGSAHIVVDLWNVEIKTTRHKDGSYDEDYYSDDAQQKVNRMKSEIRDMEIETL